MSERSKQETPPPPQLKRRVIASLRTAAVLRPGSTRRWQYLAWAAVAVAAFGAGYLAKSVPGSGPPLAEANRYVLLLYSDSTFRPEGSTASRVAEYSDWARALRTRNRLELGEKLSDSARVVSSQREVSSGFPDASPLGVIAGLFIITASDLADAVALAATCPHVRYGGRIVVRPIDGTTS